MMISTTASGPVVRENFVVGRMWWATTALLTEAMKQRQ